MYRNNFFSRLSWLIRGTNIQGLDGFNLFHPKTNFNNYSEEIQKLQVVMNNPALLKVIKLKCDLFSIGKIVEKDDAGEIIEDTELIRLLKHPNFFQNQKQFLWDFMFWNCLGNARIMIESTTIDDKNVLYMLDNSKVEFPQKMLDNADKLVLSEQTYKEFVDQKIIYRYNTGNILKIPYKKILHFFDNSNGVGNWFNGFSTVEALYKVLSNSELALDAKNTNLNLAGQFMVSQGGGLDSSMMQADDKKNIETKVGKGRKNIHAVKTAIDIKRFVENIEHLKLDDSFLNDYFLIGSIYGIPKDVLEAFNSGTYENQQVARMSLVDYVLQPKAEDLCNGLKNHFEYPNNLEMSWSHCSFMQEAEKMRYDKELKRAHTLRRLLESGVNPEDAANLLNYEFQNEINYVQRNNQASTRIEGSENE